jgi:hypothetical protein
VTAVAVWRASLEKRTVVTGASNTRRESAVTRKKGAATWREGAVTLNEGFQSGFVFLLMQAWKIQVCDEEFTCKGVYELALHN